MKKEFGIFAVMFLLVSVVSAYEFCSEGVQGENNLRIISVDDMLKDNSQEWTWKNGQEVELEIRVQNRDDDSKTYGLEVIFIDDDGDDLDITEDEDELEKEITLDAGERESVVVNFETDEDLEEGEYQVFVKFYLKDDEDEECVENSEIYMNIKPLNICPDEEVSRKELEINSLTDYTDDADDEWVWAPGMGVEVSVDLENKDYSEREFAVELLFFNENGDVADIATNSDDLIQYIDLDEDEDDEVTFNFDLRADLDEDTEYELYAKFYDSSDEDVCTSLKAEDTTSPVDVKIERLDVDFDLVVSGPDVLEEGASVTYVVEVSNLGSDDQDKVNVMLYDSSISLMEEKVIDDLESGETVTVQFDFAVPSDLSVTESRLLFTIEYDYDKNKGFYRETLSEENDVNWKVMVTGATEAELIEEVDTIISEEVVENESVLENSTLEENESLSDEEVNTLITSNAISDEGSGFFSWLVYSFLAVVLVLGVFVSYKKMKGSKVVKPSSSNPEAGFRTIKYTASLHG